MTEEQHYKKYAGYYDIIYEKINHENESKFIKWVVNKHRGSEGNLLLDMACGTERHAHFLKDDFKILW